MKTTTYDYDLEFLEDGRTIELISIGIVSSDGREYYAVSREATRGNLRKRIQRHEWLMDNVVPSLPKPDGLPMFAGRHPVDARSRMARAAVRALREEA